MPRRPGHVVVTAAAAKLMREGQLTNAAARRSDDGDLLTVLPEPGADTTVIEVDRTGDPAVEADAVRCARGDNGLVCAVTTQGIESFYLLDGDTISLGTTVMPSSVDIFDRVRGVFETDVMRGRSVAVLGLGSGGSFITRELARCGIGRFLLIDHDRLEIGNACRHECGLSDVGRLKVNAMRSLILDRNPTAEIETSDLHIGSDTAGEMSRLLDDFGPDIVICATDNRESRMLVNRHCVLARVPALYAGVFRRAYGGQVLRVIPDLAPCYQCFIDALPEMTSDREISSVADATQIAYSDREVAVEPGLSSDIVPVALHVAKLALLELLSGTRTTLESLHEDLVAPLYLWINRRELDTDYAAWPPMATGVDELSVLRWYGIALPRNESCAVCGTMTVEGVAPEAGDLDVSAFHPSAASAEG
jgi:molybdopterin/thiamine biosynthesis adenylyltransferase